MLEEPRRWEAVRGIDGEAIEEWLRPGERLPPDTLSVTLTGTVEADELLTLGVRDQDGRVLVDPRRPELSPNRLLRGRRVVVGMIPSGSAALPLSPNFQVRAARVSPGPISANERTIAMAAWVKRSGHTPAPPAVQSLPVTAFLVGSHVVDDAHLRTALGEVGRIWRRAGIEIDEPARRRIDGPEGDRVERIEIDPTRGSDSPMLGELLRLSDRGTGEGLAIFVVRDIVVGPGMTIWALSGSIPVPPVRGSPRSGIAVSGALLAADPVWAGQIIAHEVGHALGLYHTTERAQMALGGAVGPVHDPIDDTPACPREADRDRDGVLAPEECEPYDASNLMFWGVVRDGTRLTPGQSDLVRRSALVH